MDDVHSDMFTDFRVGFMYGMLLTMAPTLLVELAFVPEASICPRKGALGITQVQRVEPATSAPGPLPFWFCHLAICRLSLAKPSF
jgi:hypothetical protein